MNTNKVEEWRPVAGCDFLEVSNLGRLRKLPYIGAKGQTFPAKIIKLTPSHCGWVSVKFRGQKYYNNICYIVAEAFIPKPDAEKEYKAVTVDGDYSVYSIRWVEKEALKAAQIKKKTERKIIVTNDSIVQMRLSGEYVRRYRDIDEIIDVHPLWDKSEIVMSLIDFQAEAYGYRWDYEKRSKNS